MRVESINGYLVSEKHILWWFMNFINSISV